MGAKKQNPKEEQKVKVEEFVPPKPKPAVVKIVEVEIDKEFTEPEGWFIREVHVLDTRAVLVLVKVVQKPLRMSPPVNLKD